MPIDSKPELMRVIRSDELLPPISLWTWAGGFAMAAGCSLAILLAAVTRYQQTVKANAIIRPYGETRLVQAAMNGKIRAIQVVENQVVNQGDPIAYLEDSRAQTQVLRAPIAGKVIKLELRNSDQVVRFGETVAQIFPNETTLVVKAFVTAQDIGNVAIGQTTYLRLSAYPYPDYGVLEGSVQTIAPDSVSLSANKASLDTTSTKSADSSNRVYEITIQPKTLYFKGNKHVSSKSRNAIQAGMEGTVDIVTKEDTLLKFILRKARILTDL